MILNSMMDMHSRTMSYERIGVFMDVSGKRLSDESRALLNEIMSGEHGEYPFTVELTRTGLNIFPDWKMWRNMLSKFRVPADLDDLMHMAKNQRVMIVCIHDELDKGRGTLLKTTGQFTDHGGHIHCRESYGKVLVIGRNRLDRRTTKFLTVENYPFWEFPQIGIRRWERGMFLTVEWDRMDVQTLLRMPANLRNILCFARRKGMSSVFFDGNIQRAIQIYPFYQDIGENEDAFREWLAENHLPKTRPDSEAKERKRKARSDSAADSVPMPKRKKKL